MVVPNVKLEEVFKQVRIDVRRAGNNRQILWDLSSLTGDFFFVPQLSKPPLSVGVDLADLQTQAEAEQQALSRQQEAKSQ